MFVETPFSAIPQIQVEPRVSRSEDAVSKRLVRIVPGSARNWIAVYVGQQSILNRKLENMKTLPALLKLFLPLVFAALMPATTKALDPTAAAITTNVTNGGGTSYSFTVRYADDGEIDVGSLDSN